MRLILEKQQKYLQSFINNTAYHFMNPLVLMLHIRQSIYLNLTSVLSFIYFTSDFQHYIRSNQHNTVCTILVKVDVLDTCTRYMWSNDMFVLWNRISAIFYEDRKYCLHIFPKEHALVH